MTKELSAYELADELEERFVPFCDEAANTLRQQADIYAVLYKKHSELIYKYAELEKALQEQQLKDKFEKQSEPIGYIQGGEFVWSYQQIQKGLSEEMLNDKIALFTASHNEKQLEAMRTLYYNKGHEDGRKLVITPQTQLSVEEKIKMYQTWLITSNDPLVLFRAIEAKLRGEK